MNHKENREQELEALRKMTHDSSLEFIGIDDTFDFQCQQCGKCCIHRGDIIINPFDVFKGAKHLGITCAEFLEAYTTPDIEGNSHIPIVLLASDKKTGFCPLLKFDIKDGGKFKCMIHAAKPGVCWNHPIGVIRSTPKDESGNPDAVETTAYIKVAQCDNSKGHNSPQLVRDWVKPSLDFAEETKHAYLLQTYVERYFPMRMFDLALDIMRLPLAETAPDEVKEVQSHINELGESFFNMYLDIVYANYDTDKDFIEQAKKNMEMLDAILIEPAKLLKQLYSTMPDNIKEAIKKLTRNEHCFDWMEEVQCDD